MTDQVYVKGLSAREIEGRALAWRDALGVSGRWAPDMVEVLEHRLPALFEEFVLAVTEDQLMADAEGYTQFAPPKIVLKESVYLAAARHDPRSRMTLAHELGHLVLHSGIAKAREASSPPRENLRPYNSAEWQANKFGAGFLMPDHIVRQFGSAADLADGRQVSMQAARIRMSEVGHITKPPLPDVVEDFLRDAGR